MSYIQQISTENLSSTFDKACSLFSEDIFSFSILAAPHTVKLVQESVNAFQANADHIVFFGIGGSSLSGKLFAQTTPSQRSLTFIENVDPEMLAHISQHWNWASTHFVFTSKSGETVETMAHLKWVLQNVSLHSLKNRALVLTQPKPSSLRTFAQDNQIPIINLDPEVPGRFSAFTPTGLVPLACAGGNIIEALEAAYSTYNNFMSQPNDNAITTSVAWTLYNHHHTRPLSVLMPYAHRHYPLTAWWRQLWAESLGKQGCEFMPTDAYGTVDQHSQLQLYLDGADSRYFTLILPSVTTQKDPALQECAHLLHQSALATSHALKERQRPVRTWAATPNTSLLSFVSSLMMHMLLETALVARAYNINPFDQPAVELIKHHLKTLKKNEASTPA